VPAYVTREEAVRLFAEGDDSVDVTHVFQGDVYAKTLELMLPRPGGKADWPLAPAIVVSHDCEWTKARRRIMEYAVLVAPLRELSVFPSDQRPLVRDGRIAYLFFLPHEDPLDDEYVADLRLIQPVSAADLRDAPVWTSCGPELRAGLRAKVVQFLTRELTLR
jgi:hypothetical protein